MSGRPWADEPAAVVAARLRWRLPALLVVVAVLGVAGTLLLARYTDWRRAAQHRAGTAILHRSMHAIDSEAFWAEGEATNHLLDARVEVTYQRIGPAFQMQYWKDGAHQGGAMTDGRYLWHLEPGGQVVQGYQRLDSWDRIDLREVADRYWVLLTGRRRIAGRAAYEITVVSRDGERRARQLFVDVERHIVLGVSQFDLLTGRPVLETYITWVVFDKAALTAPQWAMPAGTPVAGQALASVTDLGTVDDFHPIAPMRLAGGFVLRGGMLGECPCGCGIRLVHLRYSDGVRGLSVFERLVGPHQCVRRERCIGHAPVGQVVSGGGIRFLTERRGPIELTLVGDLPDESLREIWSDLR